MIEKINENSCQTAMFLGENQKFYLPFYQVSPVVWQQIGIVFLSLKKLCHVVCSGLSLDR